uniref:Uncharacterized protein n=1 Tax=Physcomitrium patens TaxID=3218 RepID=A0A7I4CRH9_PHYPA
MTWQKGFQAVDMLSRETCLAIGIVCKGRKCERQRNPHQIRQSPYRQVMPVESAYPFSGLVNFLHAV